MIQYQVAIHTGSSEDDEASSRNASPSSRKNDSRGSKKTNSRGSNKLDSKDSRRRAAFREEQAKGKGKAAGGAKGRSRESPRKEEGDGQGEQDDLDIWVCLHGTRGDSGARQMVRLGDQAKFQPGQVVETDSLLLSVWG